MRGLRSRPFPKRHPWAVRFCLALVVLAFLASFLVAHIFRSSSASDFCFASLFWFVAHYSMGCFVVLTAISATLTACLIIIFFKLSRSICVEVSERVAASGLVYYLAIAIISNVSCLRSSLDPIPMLNLSIRH